MSHLLRATGTTTEDTTPPTRGSAAMNVCRGSLVLHRDGTPVLCSEELAGRRCEDLSYERHRIFRSCGLTFLRGCPECDEAVPAAAAVSGSA